MKPFDSHLPSSDRATATHSVAQSLSAAIHEHRLAPGLKLGEDELGEIFGVSRTIVRSALQALAHVQLVEMRRNRGAFVASPTPREAAEVFEARVMLEPRTAHAAALNAAPQDVALLRHHIASEHDAMAAGDRGRALALSGRFHTEIARMADQTTIADFVSTLVARSSLIIALYWRQESALCESDAHHALLDAIEAHDGPMAHDLMERHLIALHAGLELNRPTADSRSLRDALLPMSSDG